MQCKSCKLDCRLLHRKADGSAVFECPGCKRQYEQPPQERESDEGGDAG